MVQTMSDKAQNPITEAGIPPRPAGADEPTLSVYNGTVFRNG